jgi:hypothetical protein
MSEMGSGFYSDGSIDWMMYQPETFADFLNRCLAISPAWERGRFFISKSAAQSVCDLITTYEAALLYGKQMLDGIERIQVEMRRCVASRQLTQAEAMKWRLRKFNLSSWSLRNELRAIPLELHLAHDRWRRVIRGKVRAAACDVATDEVRTGLLKRGRSPGRRRRS